MPIVATREGRRTYISGDTYPVKDAIKAAGGHWDSDRKAWWIGDHTKAEALVAQVAATPASTPAPRSGGSSAYRPTKCTQCGARPGPRGWPRIYRNGICSDCYRDDADNDY